MTDSPTRHGCLTEPGRSAPGAATTGESASAPAARKGGLLISTLVWLGGLVVAGAVLLEVAGYGHAGFGLVQTMAALLGIAFILSGLDRFSGPEAVYAGLARPLESGTLGTHSLGRLAAIIIQLILFALVARAFQLESPAFFGQIVPLTVFGFVVHHVLPLRQRLSFFVVLSLAGILLVLGWPTGVWLVSVVLVLVGICHLRVRVWTRGALMVGLAVVLAVTRGGQLPAPWSPALWPVLGSMLMFRLIIYFYDIRHLKGPVDTRSALAYFLMLPNVVFPLFPVVDYATFRRTYYDQEPLAIYQEGLRWIFRGVTHLLLYRVVYQYFVISAVEVATAGELVRFLLATFLLYLRVSGQFHLIVGLMHLFGFRLPETHRFFYLASSFTDFWRRINIYWKDFMMKLVFYPVYLRLRKRSEAVALIIATFSVFFVTWLAHSYQWFWILGSWLLTWTDGLFWAILAVLLVANSLYEQRHGRSRLLKSSNQSLGDDLWLGLKTAGTFSVICVLWSFWGSATLRDWLDLMTVRKPSGKEVALVSSILVGIGLAAILGRRWDRGWSRVMRGPSASQAFARSVALTTAGLGLLYLLSSSVVLSRFGPTVQLAMRELRQPELNSRDAALLQRGYYEELTGVAQLNNQLWERYAERQGRGLDIWNAGVLRETGTFLGREMVPFFGIYQHGVAFRTNRWGMRDQEYERHRPSGTYRIALLGQSYVAGDGVNDGETFEALTEERLNREAADGASRYEILNFGVGAYSVLQQLVLLDRVFTFEPNAVYLVGSPGDGRRASLHLVQQLHQGVSPPYGFLQDVLRRADVGESTRETKALSRLRPFEEEITAWAYREIAEACRRRGVQPIWIYLYTPRESPGRDVIGAARRLAQSVGFTVVDMSDVYDGHDLSTVQVSAWDSHPNALGHRLIAERLYRELMTNPALRGVAPRPGGG